jgi:hypothetical protein
MRTNAVTLESLEVEVIFNGVSGKWDNLRCHEVGPSGELESRITRKFSRNINSRHHIVVLSDLIQTSCLHQADA